MRTNKAMYYANSECTYSLGLCKLPVAPTGRPYGGPSIGAHAGAR